MLRRLAGPVANVMIAAAVATPLCAALDRSAIPSFGVALVAATVGAIAASTRARGLPRLGFALFVAWVFTWLAPRLVGGSSAFESRDALARQLVPMAPAIVLLVAAVASAKSDAALAFAGGLFAGAVGWCPFAVVATTALSLALGDARRPETVRERLSLAGLGVLIGLSADGLGTDLAASLAPTDLHDPERWWQIDPVLERATRTALELGTFVSALAFARGRTWGALALGPLAIGLAWCSVHFGGPLWGGGCLVYAHPLARTQWSLVLVPTAAALLPWSPVLLRAIRALRA